MTCWTFGGVLGVGRTDGAVTIIIDGPAVAQGRPRMTKGGIAYTPARTRAYAAHGRLAAQQAMDGRAPLEGALRMIVEVTMPIPASWSRRKREAAIGRPHTSRPDASNFLKHAEDICTGIVYADDCQLATTAVTKLYGADPRLTITVSPWVPVAPQSQPPA